MSALTRGTIVVPAFNEGQGIFRFVTALTEYLGTNPKFATFEFTVIVVNDGSSDDTAVHLRALESAVHPERVHFRWLSFGRNFGHQAAIIAGLIDAADNCDFAVTMDADFEHPIEVIEELVSQWEQSQAPVVHTVRGSSSKLPLLKRTASSLYYRLLQKISNLAIEPGMADFKLWDGVTLSQVKAFLPQCGSTRAFASWLSPKGPRVYFAQHVSEGRVSRFTSRKMWSLALGGVTKYSDLPLRFSLMLGLFSTALGIVWSIVVVVGALNGETIKGWASTMVWIAFFGGVQLISIGILSEYLIRNAFRNALPRFVLSRHVTPTMSAPINKTTPPRDAP